MRKLIVIALLLGIPQNFSGDSPPAWQKPAPGMELREIEIAQGDGSASGKITVLRIDPKLWELEFRGISQTGEAQGHTARDWCLNHKFVAAINAGMFDSDYKTHLGYLGAASHVNNKHVNNISRSRRLVRAILRCRPSAYSTWIPKESRSRTFSATIPRPCRTCG